MGQATPSHCNATESLASSPQHLTFGVVRALNRPCCPRENDARVFGIRAGESEINVFFHASRKHDVFIAWANSGSFKELEVLRHIGAESSVFDAILAILSAQSIDLAVDQRALRRR